MVFLTHSGGGRCAEEEEAEEEGLATDCSGNGGGCAQLQLFMAFIRCPLAPALGGGSEQLCTVCLV
jgi:hypothetical protein